MDLSILPNNENGIEYFTVKATGESAVSERGLGRMAGVSKTTINRWFLDLSHESVPEWLKPLQAIPMSLPHEIKKNHKVIKPICSKFAAQFISLVAQNLKTDESVAILSAIAEIGLNSYIQGKTGWLPQDKQSSHEARRRVNRIMDKARAWEKLYEREMCDKIQAWYGFDCSKFYWWYCYSFLTPEEKEQMDKVNPIEVTVSKTGVRRSTRRAKIHQYLTQETRERLLDFADYLWRLIEVSDTRIEFEKKWNKKYGEPVQLEIFDLWDFAA